MALRVVAPEVGRLGRSILMEGSYSQRHGRKPEITTEMLVELVLRKLLDFQRRDFFFEAFNSYEDPYNEFHEARLPEPEQYVISELGRPGLWDTLGRLEGVVGDRDFPAWDEDTLFDVIELFHDRVVSSPVTDADGTFEGYSQESGRKEFREAINEILAKRSPSAELTEEGNVSAPAPPEAGQTAAGADPADGRGYDVFISHASEDKDAIARPLADALRAQGHTVFFDEYELNVGDSLRRELDRGLREARRGVVILSKAFFAKEWPQRELDALTAREASSRGSLIIPVWHEVSADEVQRYSPTLADRLAIDASRGLDAVVNGIERTLDRSAAAQTAVEPAVQLQARPPSGQPAPPQPPPAVPAPARRRIPGIGWLSKHEKITIGDWIVIGVIAAIVAGLILAVTLGGDGSSDRDDSSGGGARPGERGTVARPPVKKTAREKQLAYNTGQIRELGGRPSDQPLSPRVTIAVRKYCVCSIGDDRPDVPDEFQIKVKPRITNRSEREASLAVGPTSRIRLAIPAKGNRRAWVSSVSPTHRRWNGLLLVPPNPDGDIATSYEVSPGVTARSWATHWSFTTLAPGDSVFDPQDLRGDLAFSIPKSEMGKPAALVFATPGHQPFFSTVSMLSEWRGQQPGGGSF